MPPYVITAVPVVDGHGDVQVNWVIEADGQRVFHGGDTRVPRLLVAKRGPIDLAVLPINEALVDDAAPPTPSLLPAVMTPDQAVRAAVILRASTLVPIHYGVHEPPIYVEQTDAPVGST